jgi:hypothetical protein
LLCCACRCGELPPPANGKKQRPKAAAEEETAAAADGAAMSDAMDTSSGEENRYGVAALDQLDDDGPPSSSAAATKLGSSAADSEGKEGVEGQTQPEVESYAFAIGVIEPPPDLKSTLRNANTSRSTAPLASTAEQRKQPQSTKQL